VVNVLQLTPARWSAVAERLAVLGQDPTVVPRGLHFLLGSIAVAGIGLAVLGLARAGERADAFSVWVVQRGVRWALAATGLQVVDGFWLLFSLPRDLLVRLIGARPGPTVLVASGIGLGVLALILLSGLHQPEQQRRLTWLAASCLVGTVFLMVGIRDLVRELYLAPFLMIRDLPSRTQTDLAVLFGLVFLLGGGVLAWMVRSLLTKHSG
jgi:hypothetical protein